MIEIDGDTHSSDAERAHDARRNAFMRARGWRVMRFWNNDVYTSLEGVIDMIFAAVPPPAG